MTTYCLLSAIIVASIVATGHARPSGVSIGLDPYYQPIHSLYHSQDNGGQYVYGYASPLSTRSETKTADGVTHGGYSYIDGNGQLQTVQYTADALHGFQVAASNLPRDLPDVAAARAAHLASYQTVAAQYAQAAAAVSVPYSNPVAVPAGAVPGISLDQQLPQPVTDLPEVAQARAAHMAILQAAYAGNIAAAAPLPVYDTPEVIQARSEHMAAFAATRARDEALRAEAALSPIPDELNGHTVPIQTAGNLDVNAPHSISTAERVAYAPALEQQSNPRPYSYGYVGPHSSQAETQSDDGVVRGGYSYIDAHGIVQTVHYIADSAGFRVAATNLPVDNNHLATSALAAANANAAASVAAANIDAAASLAAANTAGGAEVAAAGHVAVVDQEPLEIVAAEHPGDGSSALYTSEVVY